MSRQPSIDVDLRKPCQDSGIRLGSNHNKVVQLVFLQGNEEVDNIIMALTTNSDERILIRVS